MNLHAFYNYHNVGDVLLIRLCDERITTSSNRIDDLCILYHDDKVIGYNLFSASLYIDNLADGMIKISPLFVEQFNKILNQYNQKPVESDYDDGFVVGKVIEIESHPDSDHLHLCKVDIKSELLQIVCGAPNVELNQLVVVAKINAVMPSGLIIKPSKLRGIDSFGMLCSQKELGLANAPLVRGIMILDNEKYEVGESFFK